jgi:putative tryptophan/tyrosine transport system substrate-binding protein
VKRREFIALTGGAVGAWPLGARAQQAAMPVIGLLSATTVEADDAFRLAAFREGLKETGYIEGRNVAFEHRGADNHYDRLQTLATELVQSRVAVIVAFGATASALAAKAATSKIPVVFMIGSDPVKFGLVASLNQPGGNVTGVSLLSNLIVQKQFEVLKEAAPQADLIGLLVNPANPNAESDVREAQQAAEALGRKLIVVRASTPGALEAGFATLAGQRVGALLVAADPFFLSQIDPLISLAARQRLPTLCPWRECAVAGGLLSYGASVRDGHRLQGIYAGRILKGEKPSELPVQQAVKIEMVVNLKTAKALGMTIPDKLLTAVDDVIE